MWSKDADQNVYFDGTTDNFKTYLECLHHWNEEGWMDTRFETRASDMFFQINQIGTAQGMVGMWYSYMSSIGDTIRVILRECGGQAGRLRDGMFTAHHDVYGTDAQKFNTPDGFYQGAGFPARSVFRPQRRTRVRTRWRRCLPCSTGCTRRMEQKREPSG